MNSFVGVAVIFPPMWHVAGLNRVARQRPLRLIRGADQEKTAQDAEDIFA